MCVCVCVPLFAASILQAAKDAAKDAAAAGIVATKNAASAGAQSAREAGKRATNTVSDVAPKIRSYASWTARRIALLLLGTAFVYGVGSSLPGAVARYYMEKDRRRRDEGRTRGSEGGGGEAGGAEPFSSAPTAVVEEGGVRVKAFEGLSLLLPGAVKALLGTR